MTATKICEAERRSPTRRVDKPHEHAGSATGAPSASVKIRAAHEVVAAWAAELALLVFQLMPAARTPAPVFGLARRGFGRRAFLLGLGRGRGRFRFRHTGLLGWLGVPGKFASVDGFTPDSHRWERGFVLGASHRPNSRCPSGVPCIFPTIFVQRVISAFALLRGWHVQHAHYRSTIPGMPISRRPPCGDGQSTNLPLTRAGRSRPLLAHRKRHRRLRKQPPVAFCPNSGAGQEQPWMLEPADKPATCW